MGNYLVGCPDNIIVSGDNNTDKISKGIMVFVVVGD